MRVRGGAVALVAVVAVAQGALLVSGGNEPDDAGPEACPSLSEDYLESEEGQQYLRDLEKLTGSTDSSDGTGDAYATVFTVTCDD